MQSSLPALVMAMALGLTISQAQIPRGPAATDRFRYDEPSGKCLDSAGREGRHRGSLEDLLRTRDAECGDFGEAGLNLTYLRLVQANLRGASFADAQWYLGSIADSDLTGANLSHTTGQMDYSGSRLRKVRFSGADLTYADLGDKDLAEADLEGARFSPHTRLPFDHQTALQRGMIFVPKP